MRIISSKMLFLETEYKKTDFCIAKYFANNFPFNIKNYMTSL